MERVLENPQWKAQYLALVDRLLAGPLGEDRMEELHAKMRPHVVAERAPYTLLAGPSDFDRSLDEAVESVPGFRTPGLGEFLARRRAFLAADRRGDCGSVGPLQCRAPRLVDGLDTESDS